MDESYSLLSLRSCVRGNLNLSFLPFLLYRGSGDSTSAARFQPLIDG